MHACGDVDLGFAVTDQMDAVEVALEIEAMSHLQAIQAAVANLGMMKLENKSDFQNLKSCS
jgi:virulence-associated protein VapD